MNNYRPKSRRWLLVSVLLAGAFWQAAAASQEPAIDIVASTADARDVDQSHVAGLAPETAAAVEPQSGMAVKEAPPQVLTIGEALARALENNPQLAAMEKEYRARDSVAWQQGRNPNPELELEFEEFGGTREAKGWRALATTLTYTHPIERGGKRVKREVAASLERDVVLWDIAELQHEIQGQVRTAYAAAQAAQYEAAQLQEYRGLVQRIYDTVAASVEAGRSARLELERFDVELARLDLEIAAAERSLNQALLELAGTWGATNAGITAVAPMGAGLAAVTPLPELQPRLDGHPALARFDAEYEALCALVNLEQANGVSDIELFGGVTRLNEIEETVFKVGISLDLPLNDRNEGNISAAGYRLEQVADRRSAVRLELETELVALHQLAQNALANYHAYGEYLLPAADEALVLTEEGYRFGKFELLDVLDAQRTVLELEREQAAALMELTIRLAEVEALLNVSLLEQAADVGVPLQPQAVALPETIEQLDVEEDGHD